MYSIQTKKLGYSIKLIRSSVDSRMHSGFLLNSGGKGDTVGTKIITTFSDQTYRHDNLWVTRQKKKESQSYIYI
jgi:hypothetical protein